MSAADLWDWMWLGICAFLTVWFGALTVSFPKAVLHGPFALLSGLIAVTHAADVGVRAAELPFDAVRLQDVADAAMLLAGAAFVQLISGLVGDRSKLPARTWWFCGIAAALALTGINHDPAATWDDVSPLTRVGPIGVVSLAITLALCVSVTRKLAAAARTDGELRWVLAALIAPVVLSSWDLYARVTDSPYGHLSGSVRALFLVVLARILLNRLVAVERALQRLTAELSASSKALAVAQVDLDRTEHLAAVGELSAVIAHEIRSPLALMQDAANALKRRPDAVDAPRLFEVLDEEADRLNRLVDDVLVYARPLVPESGEVDLASLVTLAARLALDGHPTTRDIALDWDPKGAPQWVRGDGNLLRHALINIVENAILAMPNGGTITIRLREAEVGGQAGVTIDFSDEGEGMDTQVRKRARDPFFITREGGTGLGLAIVDRVARVHGGQVTFASPAGRGTTVSFAVPRRPRTSSTDLEKDLARESTPTSVPVLR